MKKIIYPGLNMYIWWMKRMFDRHENNLHNNNIKKNVMQWSWHHSIVKEVWTNSSIKGKHWVLVYRACFGTMTKQNDHTWMVYSTYTQTHTHKQTFLVNSMAKNIKCAQARQFLEQWLNGPSNLCLMSLTSQFNEIKMIGAKL